jgi:hypothetical protein
VLRAIFGSYLVLVGGILIEITRQNTHTLLKPFLTIQFFSKRLGGDFEI